LASVGLHVVVALVFFCRVRSEALEPAKRESLATKVAQWVANAGHKPILFSVFNNGALYTGGPRIEGSLA
jgi:hypothetical protein